MGLPILPENCSIKKKYTRPTWRAIPSISGLTGHFQHSGRDWRERRRGKEEWGSRKRVRTGRTPEFRGQEEEEKPAKQTQGKWWEKQVNQKSMISRRPRNWGTWRSFWWHLLIVMPNTSCCCCVLGPILNVSATSLATADEIENTIVLLWQIRKPGLWEGRCICKSPPRWVAEGQLFQWGREESPVWLQSVFAASLTPANLPFEQRTGLRSRAPSGWTSTILLCFYCFYVPGHLLFMVNDVGSLFTVVSTTLKKIHLFTW